MIDFYFYEIIILLRSVFKEKVNVYPKLNLIYESVLNIPEIKAYEESQRAVKNLCPVQFCSQWKEKCCG